MVKRLFARLIFGRKKLSKLGLAARFFLFGFFVLFSAGVCLFFFFAKDLPRPEIFAERHISESSKIYDRTGEILLYEIYGEEKRTIIPLEKMPDYLKEAVIAVEDANFYKHFGIDLKGIIRAILADFKIGFPTYGGSTIPQQLIRSTFLSNEKTVGRKIKEIVLALELDRRYSKDQILGWYLNQVPFGQNTYGVETASQTYFRKPASEISLAETAILASLIKAPSYLSPYGDHKKELLARKDYVLGQMASKKYISQEEEESAKKEEIIFSDVLQTIKAPHFTLWVKQSLEEEYGEDYLREGGLKIYTTLDWGLQSLAEKEVAEGSERNKAYGAYNAALTAVSPKTGEVLAMVGSAAVDYFNDRSYPEGCVSGQNCLFDPRFNVAVGTKENPGRQPGSAFKPFAYVTAFGGTYTDKTTLTDEETNFGIWGEKEYIPKNYDDRFRGQVSLRQGLAQSLNIPSIKVLYLIGFEDEFGSGFENLNINNFTGQERIMLEGLKKSIQTAQKLGITTLNNPLSFYGPALVLGGGEVKLLEITSAYGAFANDGLMTPVHAVLKITDSNGDVIEENEKNPKRVLPTEAVRMLNDILSDNNARQPVFSARSPLYFENYQVAVKTGTTQDYRDGWTIGYTPSISVGVWVGNNDNTPMAKEPGVVLAGPIFHNFLEKVLLKYPKENFPSPGN